VFVVTNNNKKQAQDVHIDLWQVMKEGTGTRTGSTKALMGGIKE
jgi:hypothetical protein